MKSNFTNILIQAALICAPTLLVADTTTVEDSSVLSNEDWGGNTPIDMCEFTCCSEPNPNADERVQVEIVDLDISDECKSTAFAFIHSDDVLSTVSASKVAVDACRGVAYFHRDDLPQSPLGEKPWLEPFGDASDLPVHYYFCGRTNPQDVAYPCTHEDRL